MGSFLSELEALINRYSQENGSDTPDFILAAYMADCLGVFESAVRRREEWYGRGGKWAPALNTNPPPPDPPPPGEPPHA